MRDIKDIIGAVATRFRIRAATLATYDPDRDQEQKTLRAGLRIIELPAAADGERRSERT